MLLGALSEACDVTVVVSKASAAVPDRKGVLICPFGRKGVGRVLYPLWSAFAFIQRLGRGRDATVLVRNEVTALACFALVKMIGFGKFRLRFQSSFPHEKYSGGRLQRRIAGPVLRHSLKQADVVYVVSDAAAPRIGDLGWRGEVRAIPLCADYPPALEATRSARSGRIKFVYIGSCSAARRHDVVFEAIQMALEGGATFEVHYYGATQDQIEERYPRAIETIRALTERGVLLIRGRVPRAEVPRVLSGYDIGLNIIPVTEMFKESSATKLGEYLSQGLPVLSTSGIPYHESVHSSGGIGWLVPWRPEPLGRALAELSRLERSELGSMAERCVAVAQERLSYRAFVDEMLR
jgi:glycosyltransferase involved in cell wall biosynthesis